MKLLCIIIVKVVITLHLYQLCIHTDFLGLAFNPSIKYKVSLDFIEKGEQKSVAVTMSAVGCNVVVQVQG